MITTKSVLYSNFIFLIIILWPRIYGEYNKVIFDNITRFMFDEIILSSRNGSNN